MKDNYLSQENLEKKIIKDMEQQNPDEVFNKYYKQVENLNLQLNLEKHSIVDVKGSLRYRRQLMILIQ